MDPIRGPGPVLRGDRRAARREGDASDAGDLPRAGQTRPHRPTGRGDQVRRCGHRSQPHPTTGQGVGPLALDGGLDILVIQGTVVSAEHVSSRDEPLNLKQYIARLRGSGDRRRLRQLLDGAPPDAHRRRWESSSGLVPEPLAPPAGCSVSASPRPRRSPMPPAPGSATSTRPDGMSTSSQTGVCAPVETSPRRSRAVPTR